MGRIDVEQYKRRLLRLIKARALKLGRVVLSSGKVSDYYLDGRLITLTGQGAHLAAGIILELLKARNIAAVGGPTLGADPIVGAVISLAAIRGSKISGFIIRKAKKGHGMQRLIEGQLPPKGSRVALVDDVATTGGSLVEAKAILSKQGLKVDCAIVIVDREEGAKQNLTKAGCPLICLFKKKDIL